MFVAAAQVAPPEPEGCALSEADWNTHEVVIVIDDFKDMCEEQQDPVSIGASELTAMIKRRRTTEREHRMRRPMVWLRSEKKACDHRIRGQACTVIAAWPSPKCCSPPWRTS
ncbi:hypothetical protein ZWY2020_039728 [Hordeum vulgare]|nr:hypothetical protein ZWY2020_039728 [Hordeum vulgare]